MEQAQGRHVGGECNDAATTMRTTPSAETLPATHTHVGPLNLHSQARPDLFEPPLCPLSSLLYHVRFLVYTSPALVHERGLHRASTAFYLPLTDLNCEHFASFMSLCLFTGMTDSVIINEMLIFEMRRSLV